MKKLDDMPFVELWHYHLSAVERSDPENLVVVLDGAHQELLKFNLAKNTMLLYQANGFNKITYLLQGIGNTAL